MGTVVVSDREPSAATRALLTAHFLSDVLIGAGIGLVAAREALVLFFPALSQNWF